MNPAGVSLRPCRVNLVPHDLPDPRTGLVSQAIDHPSIIPLDHPKPHAAMAIFTKIVAEATFVPAGSTIKIISIKVCTITIRAAYLVGTAVNPAAPAVIHVIEGIRAHAITAVLGDGIALEAAGLTLIDIRLQFILCTDTVAAEPFPAHTARPALPAVLVVCVQIPAYAIAAGAALGAFFICRTR